MEFNARNKRVHALLFGAELQKFLGLNPLITALLADDLLLVKKRARTKTHHKALLRAMTHVADMEGVNIHVAGDVVIVRKGDIARDGFDEALVVPGLRYLNDKHAGDVKYDTKDGGK